MSWLLLEGLKPNSRMSVFIILVLLSCAAASASAPAAAPEAMCKRFGTASEMAMPA